MSETFLILSILGFALTVNAVRPLPGLVAVQSFFASWLTMELAPQLLVVHVIAVAAFAAAGAVHGRAGEVGLILSAGTAVGLVALMLIAERARPITEAALREALGAGYGSEILPVRSNRDDLRVPWRQLLLPFHMTHPDVERVRNIHYAPGGKRRHLLDVYHHRDVPQGRPVLLQIHGGGWIVENKDHQGRPLMLQLASREWVCVAPNYALSPRHSWPEHLVDVKRAIAWIRENIAAYGGDPDFIVVTGGSAGGHLAALAALTANDPEYQPGFEHVDTTLRAAIPHYAVYDLTGQLKSINAWGQRRLLERFVFKKRFGRHREEFERASPLFRVHEGAPPFFVIHGRYDSLVPVAEARAFVERLRAATASPVAYAELPGGQHAFDVFPSIRSAHVVRAVERFADWVWSAYAGDRDVARAPAHSEPPRSA